MTLELTLRAAVLLGGGLVASCALRQASAATRHATWRFVLLGVLLLPLISLASPRWAIVDEQRVDGAARALWAATAASGLASARRAPATLVSETSPVAGSASAPAGTVSTAVAWGVGMVAVALFHLLGHARLWMLRRRSAPAPLVWTSSATRLAGRLGLNIPPHVRMTSSIPGPLVCGMLRSTILIPSEAAHWPDARREAVLVHELTHVRRRDVQAQLLAQAVCALHWFNPLAWLAARNMRREREVACDDAVLKAGVRPTWYAAELLAMAGEALDRRTPAVALSMARPSEMEGRLLAMLADRPRHMSLAARAAVPALVACASAAVAGASTSSGVGVGSAIGQRPMPAANAYWMATPPIDKNTTPVEDHAREATTAPDPVRREQAALALAFTSGDQVIPALLAALHDPEAHVREKAAVGLAWRRDPRIVPALLEAAVDADAHVREKILVALAFSGDARAAAAIAHARTDPDPHVREKALTLSALR